MRTKTIVSPDPNFLKPIARATQEMKAFTPGRIDSIPVLKS